MNQKFRQQDLDRVLQFEEERKRAGYKPGRLYFMCSEHDLREELEYLREQGLLPGRPVRKASKAQVTAPQQALDRYIPGNWIGFPSLELLPATCRGQNVRHLVSRDTWDQIRKLTYQRAGMTCQSCSEQPPQGKLHCHEVWHYDDTNFVQRLHMLVALCEDCHNIKHFDLACVKGRKEPTLSYFMAITGDTRDEALEYFQQHTDLREYRSKQDWILDISPIKQLGFDVTPTAKEKGISLEGKDGRKKAVTEIEALSNETNKNREPTNNRPFSYQLPDNGIASKPTKNLRTLHPLYIVLALATAVFFLVIYFTPASPAVSKTPKLLSKDSEIEKLYRSLK